MPCNGKRTKLISSLFKSNSKTLIKRCYCLRAKAQLLKRWMKWREDLTIQKLKLISDWKKSSPGKSMKLRKVAKSSWLGTTRDSMKRCWTWTNLTKTFVMSRKPWKRKSRPNFSQRSPSKNSSQRWEVRYKRTRSSKTARSSSRSNQALVKNWGAWGYRQKTWISSEIRFKGWCTRITPQLLFHRRTRRFNNRH